MPGSEFVEQFRPIDTIDMRVLHGGMSERLSLLKAGNKQDGIRGRSLALAITNIEQGLFWLMDSIETIERHQPDMSPD